MQSYECEMLYELNVMNFYCNFIKNISIQKQDRRPFRRTIDKLDYDIECARLSIILLP